MKTLISLQNIHYSHDTNPLFEGLSFAINQGDRVAIVGHNGCGKSTLLSLLSGSIEPKAGTVTNMRNLRYEIVEQFLPRELEELTLREAISQKLNEEDRYSESYRADLVMGELFFSEEEGDIRVKDLSGGQKNRLMIARAIINEPELVLMDEPTNHLDVKTLLYIEDYLKYVARFSFVLISHDRRFMDNVTNKTIVLRDGMTHSFNLPYSKAMENLAKMDETAQKTREVEEKEIARLKASAKRLATWGKVYDNEDLAKKAKSMEKRIEKLDSKKTFVSRGNPYKLELATGSTRSKIALQFHDYEVFYGDQLEPEKENLLFKIDEHYINCGEKVAILGANGVGKTTFLSGLVNLLEQPCEKPGFGMSPNLELGLYDQEQEVLGGQGTLFEELCRRLNKTNEEVKHALIGAGFLYKDFHKRIRDLSGGERARVIFLILSMQMPNFLILDEPTNHIDLDGKRELEEMLVNSSATVLVTGHDREFIDKVAERFFVIRNGRLEEIYSSNEFYQELMCS